MSKDTISLTEEKQKAIEGMVLPKTRKALLSFLALAQYYGEFIKNFASLVKPLRDLTRKEVFRWEEDTKQAWAKIKELLVKPPERGGLVLVLPQFDRQFVLDTDASKYAVGAVLSQWDGKNDKEGKLDR